MSTAKTLEQVQDYYGKVLQTNDDLKTSACCIAEQLPGYIKNIIPEIHEEVRAKFYGCGCVVPPNLEGATVLDLGSGSGRDCYVISKLAGETGKVIGIDMTVEQLEVARKHVDFHTKKFGFSKPNIEFKQGFIEDLETANIASNSVDVVVSNCVINLSPDKKRVFSEIWRVLKPGGEMYISDVFSDRRLPEEYQTDKVLHGECLGGAMYIEDFRRMLSSFGCDDFRVVHEAPIEITDNNVLAKTGVTKFSSITVRAFKMDLEDRCEDYGQVATYQGGIPESEHYFLLDDHHFFEKDRPMLVCSNTASMVSDSRYGKFFKVTGDKSKHFGIFDCAPVSAGLSGQDAPDTSVGASCC